MQDNNRKRVLFIGVTRYDLSAPHAHLEKKFVPLSRNIDVFVIARGKSFKKNLFGVHFYLIGSKIFFVPLALVISVFLCARRGVSTIICQGPLTEGIVGTLLKILFKKDLIVEIHGDWVEGPFLNKQRAFAPLLKKCVPAIAKFSFSRADKIRAVAEYFLQELKQEYPKKKYFVFPTYSDLSLFFEEKKISFKRYICTVAVLSPIKSIDTLIEAFAKIHNSFPEYKLVIVGDGPSLEKHKTQITNYKLEGKVILTGRLSPDEVKDVMKDCYAFVLPSLSEGLPRVILEAMALGKPVIASNVGGIPEIVKEGECGFLVDPKDAENLAKKIEELIRFPEATKKMGERGRAFVQGNFSNEKYIENYVDMINS